MKFIFFNFAGISYTSLKLSKLYPFTNLQSAKKLSTGLILVSIAKIKKDNWNAPINYKPIILVPKTEEAETTAEVVYKTSDTFLALYLFIVLFY